MKYNKIGFIGQGFVGGNLADNYEGRGYKDRMVRYSHEPEYIDNKEDIKKCDLVFIAVPTPSTPKGFDSSILFDVIPLTSPGTVIALKSTMPPEVVRELQLFFSSRTIMLCPEFLTEVTAKFDTDHPERNIVGISNIEHDGLKEKAQALIDTMPYAPYSKICTYEEASLAKYGGNCFFLVKNMFFNVLYDLANEYGADWEVLREMITMDSRIHDVHTNPVHKGGRGAGGHCLIKDFYALNDMVHDKMEGDTFAKVLMTINEEMNAKLLKESKKDLDLLEGVFGKSFRRSYKEKFINSIKRLWK